MLDEFEDTKEVIRIHKSKTDGQQMTREQRTNKDLQKSSTKSDHSVLEKYIVPTVANCLY